MQIPNQNSSSPKRREVLKSLPLLLASSSHSFSSPQASGRPPRRTVRDSLWLWSHVAGSYNGAYNLPGKSRISPAEAAYYMSIPNIYMIHLKDKPEPPLEQYALAFKPLREVVWGIVAAGGHTNSNEREMVLDLVAHDDQITGVVMDDFFPRPGTGKKPSLTVDQIRELRDRLARIGRKLDLQVVLYEYQLVEEFAEHLKLCDVVQFWTWQGPEIENIPANLDKLSNLVPNARIGLGVYWWDFGGKKPLPMPLMKKQGELGLKYLRNGRIESMIFCGSWMCDRGVETVEWTRDWIGKVGDQKVPQTRPGK
jgi:hypothetical protein